MTHLDGNATAGALGRMLALDVTRVLRRCPDCGLEEVLAAHRAYAGAATVLRCPGCEAVAVRVAERDGDVMVEWRGVFRTAAGG